MTNNISYSLSTTVTRADIERTSKISLVCLLVSTPALPPVVSGLVALAMYELQPGRYDYIFAWLAAAALSLLTLPMLVVFIVSVDKVRKSKFIGKSTPRDDRRVYVAASFWSVLLLFWVVTGLVVAVSNL